MYCAFNSFVPCEDLLSRCMKIFLWELKGVVSRIFFDPPKLHLWKIEITLKWKCYPQKRKIRGFFREYFSLFGITAGNTWIRMFSVLKTMEYSIYRYGTICLRNFNICAYREVNTCVTEMQDEP